MWRPKCTTKPGQRRDASDLFRRSSLSDLLCKRNECDENCDPFTPYIMYVGAPYLTTLQFKKLKILALCVLHICACGRISEKGDTGKQSTSVQDLEGQVWLAHTWCDEKRRKQTGSRNRHQVNGP